MILVGSSMFEGLGYVYSTNAKGLARAFDARTGKLLWRFTRSRSRGEFGNETWENGSWDWTGNVGVWTADHRRPGSSASSICPSKRRRSTNTAATAPATTCSPRSLVAVDLKTGMRKWHFQFVHHPLWDHDMSSAPLLIDTTIDGKPRKVVAVPSKQGWLYCFDRITGAPIWPIEEKPVPQTTMKREKTSPRRSRSRASRRRTRAPTSPRTT